MAAGELDKRLIASIAIAVVGLAMLIAGSVMLGVGIHKANQKSNCPSQQQCQPCNCPQRANPSAVFTTSYSPSIQYTKDLSDPNSDLFKQTSQVLAQNITTLLNSPVPQKASLLYAAPGTQVTINSFQQSVNGVGVNFYASIVFPYNGMKSEDVQTQMNQMYPTAANSNPTSSCNSLVLPPGETTVAPPSTVVTNALPTTTQPAVTLPPGVFCNVTGQSVLTVFLIDTATPSKDGTTLSDKLATIQSFLDSYDQWIGLHNQNNWGNVAFQYVTYNGAVQAASQLSSDDDSWHDEVGALRAGYVNPTNSSSHLLSKGLKTVFDNTVLVPGQARNLIIISDGIEITDTDFVGYADDLKKTQNYQIGAFLASSNIQARQQFEQVVTNDGFLYAVDDMSWLSEPTVDAVMAMWTCEAPPPLTPQPITRASPPPLKTTPTTPTPTTTRPAVTTSPGPVPVPNCAVDVLFLVDESLSMIKNGYSQSINYVKLLSQQVATTQPNSSFAIITFNSAIVYQSPNYMGYDQFIQAVNSINIAEGSTNFIIGFNAARTLISTKSRYSVDGVRSLLIFLSDGFNDDANPVQSVKAVSHDLRSTYLTEIIALGLSEDLNVQQLTKQAIDYGAQDAFVQSQYIDVPNSLQLTNGVAQNNTLTSITCKSTVLAPTCATDFIFVIEVSEAETDSNIEVERKTVNNLISYYQKKFGPNAGEVSLVYFSAPDGLQGSEFNRSGILYSMVDDYNLAINQLTRYNFHPLGGASDINLAMNLVLNVLNSDMDNNDQLVLFFARGAYADAPNCCSDPTAASAAVRSKATVQGISIGTFPDIATLSSLTGSKAIDGNALVVNNNGVIDTDASARAIQNALIPIIDSHLNNVYCAPMPSLVVPCSQFDDVVIIMHASSQSNWDIMKQFVIQLVIPALTGPLSQQSSKGLYINMAITTYFGQTVTSLNQLSDATSTEDIATALNASAFVNSAGATNTLSRAYKEASNQYVYSRRSTSKTVLVITDTADIADYESATVQRSHLPSNSFVYGLRVGNVGDFVPGQDDGVIVTDIQQLNPMNQRTSISYANTAANGVCKYIVATTQPIPTTPTPKPTPGPIPKVKPRNVWPDITILIDVSQQNPAFFESQRMFLRKTFLNQFRIGDSWSRFSVATYSNATNIVCRFSDISTYWDLEACLGSQISYTNVVNPSVTTRDIDQALSYLNSNLYNSNVTFMTGYKALKENYLYVLTNGKSSSNFYNSATNLKMNGIRIIGIDISSSNGMNSTDLSDFGPDSFKVPNWQDSSVNDMLSQALLVQTTEIPSPMLSSLFSDFYFVVDNSFSQTADIPNIQQFINKFVEQLTVSPHRSRVSIIPFSDRLNLLQSLTDSPAQIANFLAMWQTSGPGAASSNIGLAIANVQSQVQSNPGRIAHVIYIVGANSTSGAESAAALNGIQGVTSYSLSYNSNLNYDGLLSSDVVAPFKIQGSASLLNWVESQFPVNLKGRNPMNQFFIALLNVQEQADSTNFPMKEVAADVIIFLDETGLSPEDFAHVKQYLKNFTSQFTISRTDTQFAFQAFSGQIIPEAGWHFYDCVSNDVINSKIDNLTLEVTPADSPADLSGAVDQALIYFLQPMYGWREDATTYSIIITNAETFAYVGNTTTIQDALIQKTLSYAMSLNNKFSSYVFQFVDSNFYELVPGPQALNTETGPGKELSNAINENYRYIVYPPMIPLNQINADFIFLIDNTNVTQNTNQIRTFLRKMVAEIGTFGQFSGSRMAVINYNSKGVIESSSWTLNTYSAADALKSAIGGLSFSNDTNPPDLSAAVGYFYSMPSLFGINRFRPVFVTGIFNSPAIKSPLSPSIMASVNLNYFSFALQYNGNFDRFNYLPQFLGNEYSEDFVYTNDLSTYGVTPQNDFYPYNEYIQSSYTAWMNSYGYIAP